MVTVWQGSLQGVTFGTGTNYHFGPDNITGVGVPTHKTPVVDLAAGDGGYAGPARKGSRVITIPFIVLGTTPENTMDNFETLAAAFVDPDVDVTLELWLPGKHFSVDGRPLELIEDLSRLKGSRIDCVGGFVAYDPTMTAI